METPYNGNTPEEEEKPLEYRIRPECVKGCGTHPVRMCPVCRTWVE